VLLPLGIIILLISSVGLYKTTQYLTPTSISVKGYFRGNGVYIHSYKRRPPGGALHDAPFQSIKMICLCAILAGIVVCSYSIIRFKKLNSNNLLGEIKKDIIQHIRKEFELKLPNNKKALFSLYYISNYDEYHAEENRFIISFKSQYADKTALDFDDLDYLKKLFESFVKHEIRK
jgi:hypothetical protein